MTKLNVKTAHPKQYTHESAVASRITPIKELGRSVMACMLWEDNFYENGQDIAARIKTLVPQCNIGDVAKLAVEARSTMKLRHIPLLLVREMARHPERDQSPGLVRDTLYHVIQRADELTEFLAIYWKDGKQPLSAQVKKGLALAFTKFKEHDLAKYNRDGEIKLRDVLFLAHAKPGDVPRNAMKWDKDARRVLAAPEKYNGENVKYVKTVRPDGFTPGELMYERIVYNDLKTPDTWEVALSGGADKKATFERLMAENKLGDLAFLRNLRNMNEAGVSRDLIKSYGDDRNWGRVLPFRFISAARVMPGIEPILENWMLKCLEGQEKLSGHTILLVDVSGSMASPISNKSDLRRVDAANGLAMLLREICENITIISFSNEAVLVPPRRGFALADAIKNSQRSSRIPSIWALSGFSMWPKWTKFISTDL